MGKVEKYDYVQYDAGHFEKAEKAKVWNDSAGKEKGRIHLLGYKGGRGSDPYAVAAEVMERSEDGSDPKLGWWDRNFNILMKDDGGTWYKINKNSFLKRINPSEELKIDEETGVCSNFKELVNGRVEGMNKLKNISTFSNPAFFSNFESAFLHQLSINLAADKYKKIIFTNGMNVETINTPRDAEYPVLVVTYCSREDESLVDRRYGNWLAHYDLNTPEKQLVRVHLDASRIKKIESGNPFPQSLIDSIVNGVK